MSVAETLLNATLVLIPLWLGLVRYLTTDAEFESETWANMASLGIVVILMGILYSMSTSIEVLSSQQPDLRIGLYVLFITLVFTGLGGVFFIGREIPETSFSIVAGVPTVIIVGIGGAILLPQLITSLPSPSFSGIMSVVGLIASLIGLVMTLWQSLSERERKAGE